VIVENKPGASGSIGALQVLRAPADGHTLFFTNNATNGAYEQLNPKFNGYRTLRDFAPVALFGVVPNILVVRSTLPVRNMTEFLAYARANPGKLNFGSSAIGSAPHMAAELLQSATGTSMMIVPFSGAGPLMQSLVGGDLDAYIGGPSTVMEHVKSGRIRALGALHPTRLRSAPDVPTYAEQGIRGADYNSWFGLIASAATPAALLDRINADARKVMDTPQIRDRLDRFSVEYWPADRAQFWGVVQEEIERSGRIIREKKLTID
jgi:tripartite-type tricarboxylate transporter receptor subunit TctC